MTDELDRIRDLRGDSPGPSDRWVRATRDELLQMAADEEQASSSPGEGVAARWRRLLSRLTTPRRVAWVAAAAAVIGVALAGSVLLGGPRTGDGPDLAAPGTPKAPEPTTSTTPSTTASENPPDGVRLAATCTGGDGIYSIQYPADWHTPAADASGYCQDFDDEPLEVGQGVGGGPFGAVTVRPLPVDLATAADPGRAHRELSPAEEVTVDDHPAVRTLWESTGGGALPEGLRSYRYLIDLDDRTLLVATFDVDDDVAFGERRQLLDAMVDSLDLRDTAR